MAFFEPCVDHSLVINWSCGFADCAINESPDVCCCPISFVLYQLHQIWHTIVPDAGIIQVWHGNLT